MATPRVAIPQNHHGNPKQYYPNNNNNTSPQHSATSPHHPATSPQYPGTSPGSSTSPRSSAGSQQFYPQSSVNFHPGGSPPGGTTSSPRGSSTESKNSVGSVSGYRPPSAQSAGYRLAQGLEDADGYLEPRSSAGSYQLQQPGRPPTREHDSGVDIDHSRDSGNNHDNQRSSGSGQSSKSSVNFHPAGAIGWAANDPSLDKDMTKNVRPDSLAYRHDYEELPTKYSNTKYGYADIDENKLSNLSVPNHSAGSHEGNSNENLTGQAYRRRQNPLYDAVVREDSKVSGKSMTDGCNRCLCVSIILLTLLCLLSVILACIAVSGVANANLEPRTGALQSTSLQDAQDKIADLESKYKVLMDKMVALESSDVAMVLTKLTNHSDQLSTLTLTMTRMQTQFGRFTNEIRDVAHNISKMPGPMGPPGAGNMSQCEHKHTSRSLGIGTGAFSTTWVPNEGDHNRFIILGVECTTDTKFQKMELQTIAGFNQYRCSCSGDSVPSPNENRHCEMDYWRCPRIS